MAQGISAGVAILTIAPQSNYPKLTGDLVMTYDDVTITLVDSKIDVANLVTDTEKRIIQVNVIDRRWKWRYGGINGNYNRKLSDNSIIKGTEKTPRELARLLFEAMGESEYSTANLPDLARPEVDWSRANPAEELASLCESLGCRVVLNLDNSVSIEVAGQGATLPTKDAVSISDTIDPPERPDNIAIVCGPTRYQVDIPLIGVGQDTDGSFRKWKDLSYAIDKSQEVGGFQDIDYPDFLNIPDLNQRKLAAKSIFRMYYPDVPLFVQRGIPGLQQSTTPTGGDPSGKLTKQEQEQIEKLQAWEDLLPLGNDLVDTVIDIGINYLEPIKRNRDAIIYGVFRDYKRESTTDSTVPKLLPITDYSNEYAKKATYQDSFRIHEATGLIEFADPMYRLIPAQDGSGGYWFRPAQLVFRTTVNVRRHKDHSYIRYERWTVPQKNDVVLETPTQYVEHDDIVVTVKPKYNLDNFDRPQFDNPQFETNVADVIKECQYYLDAINAEYVTENPQSIAYNGLKKIGVDGAITNVTFEIGSDGGAKTSAQRNTDSNPAIPSYKERRRMEQNRDMSKNKDLLKKSSLQIQAWGWARR